MAAFTEARNTRRLAGLGEEKGIKNPVLDLLNLQFPVDI